MDKTLRESLPRLWVVLVVVLACVVAGKLFGGNDTEVLSFATATAVGILGMLTLRNRLPWMFESTEVAQARRQREKLLESLNELSLAVVDDAESVPPEIWRQAVDARRLVDSMSASPAR